MSTELTKDENLPKFLYKSSYTKTITIGWHGDSEAGEEYKRWLDEIAIPKIYNQAIEEALQQVEKYNTGKELTPIVTAIINSIKQLKK